LLRLRAWCRPVVRRASIRWSRCATSSGWHGCRDESVRDFHELASSLSARCVPLCRWCTRVRVCGGGPPDGFCELPDSSRRMCERERPGDSVQASHDVTSDHVSCVFHFVSAV
jgi:hypothetical protein